MTTLQTYLMSVDACSAAMDWLGDRDIIQCVADCPRGDWLLWLAQSLEIDKRKLTLAKGSCANTVRHLMKDERSITAVDAAIAYGNGEIDESALKVASAAAYAAYAAASADDYAAAARENNELLTSNICRDIIGDLIVQGFNIIDFK